MPCVFVAARSTQARLHTRTRLASTSDLLREMSVSVICVSDTQRRGVEATLHSMGVQDRVQACTIYNPVDDALAPDGSRIDERKLVFSHRPTRAALIALDASAKKRMPGIVSLERR